MNMNDTIDLSGISADKVYRIRRSKKNGKLISYNEYGKVIIIKNWKNLHVGYGKVVSFENRENCILATMKNVPYDFYEEYNEKTGEVEAVPYEELTRILQELGFAHEYKEDIDKDNIFDVWANLDSGVLITIETWNQDGERGYNSVNCYVPSNGFFTMPESTGFSNGSSFLSCFNIVHNTRDFPLHECLAFNNGSMNWGGNHPALWHYGEGYDINYAKALAKIRKFKDADIGERFNMQLDESFAAYAKNGYTAD